MFLVSKGTFNFVYRKFRQSASGYLCPVRAVVSILRRANALKLGFSEPLGRFLGANHRQYFVTGRVMQMALQQACRDAYPDLNHHMRRNIHCIMSHCMHVAAAVALQNAGCSIDDIAYRLRWNSDSIKLYLRDCYRFIGQMTEQAVQGAYITLS